MRSPSLNFPRWLIHARLTRQHDGTTQEVDAADFTACAAPANGKATCTTTDPDFLGAAYDHAVQVECGIVCNEVGFALHSLEPSKENRS